MYLLAHAHTAKSCDACHAPKACAVSQTLSRCASTLILGITWTGIDRSRGDVLSVMDLALMGGVRDAAKCFDDKAKKAGKRDLVALIMFRGNHYTSFVRKGRDWNKGWEWHDRAPSINWAGGGRQCAGGRRTARGHADLLVRDVFQPCFNLSSLFLRCTTGACFSGKNKVFTEDAASRRRSYVSTGDVVQKRPLRR